MLTVLQLGGHQAAAPGMAELLNACADDDLAASLMARLLRGDTSVKPTLGARLQQLRAAAVLSRSARPTRPGLPARSALPSPPTPSGDKGARAS